jgi:hypothetical protein
LGQDDAAAAPAAVGESAPALPPQRDPETPGAQRVPLPLPAPRPEAGEEPGPPTRTEDADTPAPDAQSGVAPGALPDAAADVPAVDVTAPGAGARLGARERAVLDFERRRWKHAGAKEQAIRDSFDLSATRYYQILNALLDDPAALAYAPALVGRLRRIREAKQQARR